MLRFPSEHGRARRLSWQEATKALPATGTSTPDEGVSGTTPARRWSGSGWVGGALKELFVPSRREGGGNGVSGDATCSSSFQSLSGSRCNTSRCATSAPEQGRRPNQATRHNRQRALSSPNHLVPEGMNPGSGHTDNLEPTARSTSTNSPRYLGMGAHHGNLNLSTATQLRPDQRESAGWGFKKRLAEAWYLLCWTWAMLGDLRNGRDHCGEGA